MILKVLIKRNLIFVFFAVAAALLVIGWPLVYIKTRYDKKKYGEAA